MALQLLRKGPGEVAAKVDVEHGDVEMVFQHQLWAGDKVQCRPNPFSAAFAQAVIISQASAGLTAITGTRSPGT